MAILHDHNNTASYTPTILAALDGGRLSIFSKPFEKAAIGTTYAPPAWNVDQRARILSMIEAMPFKAIEEGHNFVVTSMPAIRETMQGALNIVVQRVGRDIAQIFLENRKPSIFAVELRPFIKFLEGLKEGLVTTDFETYLSLLRWNHYFEVSLTDAYVRKLSSEMDFINNFLHPAEEKFKARWIDIIPKNNEILNAIYSDAQAIVAMHNTYSRYVSRDHLETKPAMPQSLEIPAHFTNLCNTHREKSAHELRKNDVNDIYYKNVTVQRITGTENVYGYVDVKYVDYETEKYWSKEKRQVPVEKQVTETVKKTKWVPMKLKTVGDKIKNGFMYFGTLGKFDFTMIPVPETYYEDETRMVTYFEEEEFDVEKTRPKRVEKTRQEYRITGSRPVYGNFTERHPDNEKYATAMASFNNQLTSHKQQIEQCINHAPQIEIAGRFDEEAIHSQNDVEKLYEALQTKWQRAEVAAYLTLQPECLLKNFSILEILDRLIQ